MRVSQTRGAVAWLCTLQFFICARIAAASAVPGYDGIRQVLSDLGVRECVALRDLPYFCSPAHALFAASLCVQGTCMIAGAWWLRGLVRDRFATIACCLAGATLYGIAAIPENGQFGAHVAFAAGHCVAANVWLLRMAALARATPGRYPYPAPFFGLLGLLGAGMSGLLLCADLVRPYLGLVERSAVYAFPTALILCGFAWLREARRGRNFAIQSGR